jgi:hypothetical protein
MTHLANTRLKDNEAGQATIRLLQAFNVRHVEQLDELLQSYGGRIALDELDLPLDSGHVSELIKPVSGQGASESLQLSQRVAADTNGTVTADVRLGLGYQWIGAQSPPVYSEVLPKLVRREAADERLSGHFHAVLLKYKPIVSIDQRIHCIYDYDSLPEPKDQGARGTCVAFAITSALHAYIECHVKNFTRIKVFSEQYLFYEAKRQDQNRDDDGTRLECALIALAESGVCAENHLPYKSYVDWSHSLLFQKSSTDLKRIKKLAAGNRISGFAHLPERDIVDNIKACLIRNLAASSPFAKRGTIIMLDRAARSSSLSSKRWTVRMKRSFSTRPMALMPFVL